MKASCLGTGTPDSVLEALCDFSVPWKYMVVSREATGGNRPYLQKRLVFTGHILFPQLHILECILGCLMCYSSYLFISFKYILIIRKQKGYFINMRKP